MTDRVEAASKALWDHACLRVSDEAIAAMLSAADSATLASAEGVVRELLERRAFVNHADDPGRWYMAARPGELCQQAAATIQAMAGRIAELLEAGLKPLADEAVRTARVHP